MQKVFSLSLLLFISLFVFAQTYVPSGVDTITDYGNYHPQIEIANDNNPILLWTDQLTKSVFTAKYNGTDFNTPVQLNPVGLQVQSYNWSGADLAIWGDNVYVVFRSHGYETGHVYLVKSIDNGNTFGDTIRVDHLATGFGQYPDVAVFNDTVFVTFMDHNSSGLNPQYVVSRSLDGGATFQSEVVAGEIIGDEACDCCQPEIVVNEQSVILFFRNNNTSIRDIKATVSYDRGATFTSWFSVDDHQWYLNSCPSTGPDAMGTEDNRVLTSYRTYENNVATVFLNEYDITQNLSLTLKQISSGISPNPNYPQIAYQNGNLGMVWEGLGQSVDVFFIASNTGISGLDTVNTLNLTNTIGPQSKPDIVFDGSQFHIVYANGFNLEYLQVSELVSISDSKPDNMNFGIFPNPSTGIIHFDGMLSRLEVYDIYGNLIGTFSNKTIDISGAASGIYFLKATDEQGRSWSRKLVKH
ncbi:MAG TPA: T9SS type A sorting domain-containing protein [Flavobacteriales bacterium]|nr:T9SS type A sorting domain-containing protein [Flavobacteriales bacterium]HIN39241.1 T9SS type A sorting domain-containing protein [Flavobacteriales bacterium]